MNKKDVKMVKDTIDTFYETRVRLITCSMNTASSIAIPVDHRLSESVFKCLDGDEQVFKEFFATDMESLYKGVMFITGFFLAGTLHTKEQCNKTLNEALKIEGDLEFRNFLYTYAKVNAQLQFLTELRYFIEEYAKYKKETIYGFDANTPYFMTWDEKNYFPEKVAGIIDRFNRILIQRQTDVEEIIEATKEVKAVKKRAFEANSYVKGIKRVHYYAEKNKAEAHRLRNQHKPSGLTIIIFGVLLISSIALFMAR